MPETLPDDPYLQPSLPSDDQGKIERYYRSMKNVVKLDTYFYPWELEQTIAAFVTYYNHERYHESLDNLTPVDVYHGRTEEVKTKRWKTKEKTLE